MAGSLAARIDEDGTATLAPGEFLLRLRS
jgi:hypothetical protein